MNMHLSPHDPEIRAQLQREDDIADSSAAKKRRGWLIALVAALATAAFIWFLVQKANAPKPQAPPAGPPSVTVMVPGTSLVADRVAAVGTIHARRDMPVGVAGEGGMISAIRAEAGQYVGKGQVLAEIDSAVQRAQLQQLQASVTQAQADARLAQAELERAETLVSRGFISKADIDRRTATRDSARARVSVAQAQVREMQERLNRLAIRAPEAGLVLQRMVEPGQIVSPGGGALYRIAAGGQLELRAQVAEQDMPGLAPGQAATVTPVGSSNSYAGSVWLLEPVIDPESRQGVARIALPRAAELRSGGFANVVVEGARAQRPSLPQSAVLFDNEGSYVLTVGSDDVVKRVAVTTGAVTPAGVVILSGLTGQEKVVQSAGAFLHPGEKVTPKPAARPAAGAAAPAAASPSPSTSG
ncbi:efflux RND transporter periplasmic adaptor subunit [Sandaracinobacter sp. RS1-74]|uniref:efflux RND transporter periplasmic adaptor subunit n=1 Tax=Sandaracinobacteroides sayramensis TaxID=2913411 RepID=UPI001EDBC842|nr:efflux RND transporter periplasmic adaptor subunit [Sandaracinobacteroides sayramensis]MCG2842715.1 efflux RND transporter periplasmic adaptor subunit [Sandaracinobacteroides sayramensis]